MLMLAWIVLMVSLVLPLALTFWVVSKGGRDLVENRSRHDAIAKELWTMVPGGRALVWLSRLSAWTLAIAVLINGGM